RNRCPRHRRAAASLVGWSDRVSSISSALLHPSLPPPLREARRWSLHNRPFSTRAAPPPPPHHQLPAPSLLLLSTPQPRPQAHCRWWMSRGRRHNLIRS